MRVSSVNTHMHDKARGLRAAVKGLRFIFYCVSSPGALAFRTRPDTMGLMTPRHNCGKNGWQRDNNGTL